ncbi:NADH:ubiquinone oxidoreductase intermediate-associated protein 30, partial [Melia azedarach]
QLVNLVLVKMVPLTSYSFIEGLRKYVKILCIVASFLQCYEESSYMESRRVELMPPNERYIFNFSSKEELKKWHLYSDSEYGGLSLASLEIADSGNGLNGIGHYLYCIMQHLKNVVVACEI